MATHKKPESERFKGPVKFVEYLLARGLVTFLQRVPIRFAYRLGRAVGWLAWRVMVRRREIVRKNLGIINAWITGKENCPQGLAAAVEGNRLQERNGKKRDTVSSPVTASPQPASSSCHPALVLSEEAQVKEVFQRAGANLFSGFTFNRMPAKQVGRHIRIEGIEYFNAAVEERRGVVVLLAHMGPWEALTQLPRLAKLNGLEAKFGAMYRPLNNRYLDDWYRTQREARGTRLFSRRDGFHKPVDFLRAGGILGILADQKMKRGERVPFFGQEVKTSPIAGLMQRRSKAVAVSMSVSSDSTCQWTLKIRPFEFPSDRSDRDRVNEAAVCNQALEVALSDSFLDGFWFHGRF